ncbi:hypothetical protein B0H10DRAFT_2229955 [Mycena sp. CBHHK59/15]|nr:hypothetical protein B0H10DRAFT_2229955 [Mycena sp. CBHHK59/15]
MSQIAEKVLERSGKEAKDDSVVGLLIKALAESPDGEFRLSHEEVLAHVPRFSLPDIHSWLPTGAGPSGHNKVGASARIR